jgi:hypothetical protein
MVPGILIGSRPGSRLIWSGTMAASDKLFAGSIPEIYDRFRVPLIFEADALALPFEDQSFDVVACQFGTMFFPDNGAGFFFNVWDKIAENEFADVVTETLATMFPQDPPRFLARTPHGYHDVATLREELTMAGFAQVRIETRGDISRAPSPREPAIAYCQGTPLRNEIEARDPAGLEAATQACTEALARRFGNDAVAGRISAHVITAVR